MRKTKMDARATSLWCRNMAMLLAAGTLPETALEILQEDASAETAFEAAQKAILENMRQGAPFAQAVQKGNVLPLYAADMLAAGEKSGRTEQVLNRLADYYDRQDILEKRVRNAVTYPLFLLLLMCLVLAFLVAEIVPVFTSVYESLSGALIGSAYTYVAAAKVVAWIALAVTMLVSIALLVGILLRRTEAGERRMARCLEKFPLTAKASELFAVSRMMDALAAYVASGLDGDTAVQQASLVVTHTELKAKLDTCVEQMQTGKTITQAFVDNRVLPSLYARAIQSGARSGKLDAALAQLAELTGRDAEDAASQLIENIEPLLTGFLTIVIGVTLLSAMLPLVGILGAIG